MKFTMSQHGCARSRVSTPQWCKPSSFRASKVRVAAVYGADFRVSTPITAANVVEESTGPSCSNQAVDAAVLQRSICHGSRLTNQTHPNTLVMTTADELQLQAQLHLLDVKWPLSQLAFKVLLRASLAAARLHHGYITTLHILLGLVSAAAAAAADSSSSSSSSEHPLAAAADKYVEAEAAVAALIDGPSCSSTYAVRSAVGAAHTLLGQSRGLAVINWCGQLSTPAIKVLQEADQMRLDCGDELITSCHILSALLSMDPPSYRQQQQQQQQRESWTTELLSTLGLDPEAVAAAAAAASGSQQSPEPHNEDALPWQPVGFLHEEFAYSLARSLNPAVSVGSSLN